MNVTVEFESMYPKVKKVIRRKLGRNKAWGLSNDATGTIEIDPRCKGIKDIEILLHESLHIVAPFLSEEAVSALAAEQARVIWGQGYRRSDNDTSQKLQDEID